MRALLPLLLLAACAAPQAAPPPIAVGGLPQRPLQLIGKTADEVRALLGTPRLDIVEGASRTLQYAGAVCVLDVFFYPDRRGKLAAANLDARTRSGAAHDAASCVAALTGSPSFGVPTPPLPPPRGRGQR
jgi:hypothetical protein